MKGSVNMLDTENMMELDAGSTGHFRNQDLYWGWRQFLGRAACYVG